MTITSYLREIGRGPEGSRALTTTQANDLMGQLLDGALSDLQIGAFAIAMRVKGETLPELIGFLEALQARLVLIHSDQPVLVIPSYNGARRLPNLVPLLALLLARQGERVLVHGPATDPGRVTSAEVFQALGLTPLTSADAVPTAWAQGQPAFVLTQALSPALQRLLDVRRAIGLRNAGHTIAKMMWPLRGAAGLRLMSHTHPEFGRLMSSHAEQTRSHVMLLRGTEGEAVADARRMPRLQTWIDGQLRPELGTDPTPGSLSGAPAIPREIDADNTARWTRAMLDGETPVPGPIETQARLLQLSLQQLRSLKAG